MRKIVLAAAVAGAVLALSACGETPEAVAPEPTAVPSTKVVTESERKAFLDSLEKATTPMAASALALEAPDEELKAKARKKANDLLRSKSPQKQ